MYIPFYTFGLHKNINFNGMRNFDIQLKKTDNYVYESNYKSVIKNGKNIGTFKMVLEDSKVIGVFELDEDIHWPQYIKYNSITQRNKKWISNIEFLDKETPETVQAVFSN
jgi:hypothetical protein